MNAYIVEGAMVSSSSSLINLQQSLQEKPARILGIPGMFNAESRIEQILKLSRHAHAEKQLDELRHEHVQFAYQILNNHKRLQALQVIQQYFNLLDDYLRAVALLQELSESTIRKAKCLLQEISAEMVHHFFLQENGSAPEVLPINRLEAGDLVSSGGEQHMK